MKDCDFCYEKERFPTLKQENEQLKQEKCELLGIIQKKDELIKKMKCCENCKHGYHDRYHTLQCIRNCINFNKWELAE